MPEFIIPLLWTTLFTLIIFRSLFFNLTGIGRYWVAAVFIAHVLAGCANYYIWLHVIGHGDSLRYIHDSRLVYDQLSQHPLWYLELLFRTSLENVPPHLLPIQHALYIEWHVPEYNMVRWYAIMNIFSFGSAWGNITIQSFIGFAALTALYKTAIAAFQMAPALLFAVLFCVPSVVFWSNGLLKEAPALILISVVVTQLIRLESRVELKNMIALVLALAGIWLVRDYVFYLLVPNMVIWMLVRRRAKKRFTVFTVATVLLTGLICLSAWISPSLNIFNRLSAEQSYFLIATPDTDYSFHTLTGTLANTIVNIPYAINNILFRPNLLHSSSPFRIYQSVESLLLWSFLVWVILRRSSVTTPSATRPMLLFFSAELLLVYGLIVTDADSLSRYRTIPVFLLLFLAAIKLHSLKKKENVVNTL